MNKNNSLKTVFITILVKKKTKRNIIAATTTIIIIFIEANNIAKLICGLQNGIILFVFNYILFILTVVKGNLYFIFERKDTLNEKRELCLILFSTIVTAKTIRGLHNSIVTVVWNIKIII